MVRKLLRSIILSHYERTFQKYISMSDLCESIRNYRYAFVKLDVPYMPADFPRSVPIGKDADIICLKDDFENIRSAVFDWSASIPEKYNIRTVEDTYGFRVRICGVLGILLYQIDVSWNIEGVSDSFMEDAITTRTERDGLYILDRRYEYIYRMHSFSSDRRKVHHKKYLIERKEDYDEAIAKNYLNMGIKDLVD